MPTDKPDTRLQEISDRLAVLAIASQAGSPLDRSALSEVIADLRGFEVEKFGSRKRSQRGDGARARIRTYLLARPGEVIPGAAIAEVSGIQDWPRRIRELRVQEGYSITEVGSGSYRLESDQPDRDRASAWRTANVIRKQKSSGLKRIEAFLEAQVGLVVDRQQIDYVARIAEGSRRVRKLRDEFGWPINSHIDEPELAPGQYRLTSIDEKDRRDPLQRLYPEGLRHRVFERDDFTCQVCKRNRRSAHDAGDSRFYLEVHHKVAVAAELEAMPKSARNQIDNLVTLCHADHLRETETLQRKLRAARRQAKP